jgi:hypothetical protein
MDDRTLIGRALVDYTRQGWQMVNLSNAGIQLKKEHHVGSGTVGAFVALPVMLGVFAALISVAWGTALFSLALVFGALIALNHMTVPPQLMYITMDQLRSPQPAQVVRDHVGLTVCSVCLSPVRSDAKSCHRCNAQFQQVVQGTAQAG